MNSGDRKTHRYLWPSQSRASLLTWKLFGRRTDGFPEELVRGAESDHAGHLIRGGDPYRPFKGSIMPPPDAVKEGKVKPLTDEDRRTILRWIDRAARSTWITTRSSRRSAAAAGCSTTSGRR